MTASRLLMTGLTDDKQQPEYGGTGDYSTLSHLHYVDGSEDYDDFKGFEYGTREACTTET